MTPLACLVAFLPLAWGFNLDPRHAVVVDDPESDKDSYFGYALDFWRQSNNAGNSTWLLVGAPQAQDAELRGERVRQPGAVYKCSTDDVKPRCHRLSILGEEDRKEQDLRWRWKIMNIPKRAWLGATITVEKDVNGAVVVCAPRMKQMQNRDVWFIPGMCFYWKSDDEVLPLAHLETVYRSRAYDRRNGFVIGLAQSGMAAHFVENSTTSKLVVGSPGVEYFTGAVTVYEQDHPHSRELPSPHVPTLPTNSHSYLGYSVTSARLHTDGRVSYIAGAPRDKGADFFTGAVHVLSGAHHAKWSLETRLEGQQMGEYFGATVATLDLSGDGVDDLVLVGAPLHSTAHFSAVDGGEQGRLYVFKNVGQGMLEMTSTVLTGSSVPGARFASSISAIGDLNRDGYNDIAVGAPYEGGGAVYIYLGGRHGLSSSYSQRISAAEVRGNLRGFGVSIASGVDLDGNSFNDLAIGSYESGNVVIVKSRPIIEMEATLQPAVSNLDVNARSIDVKACLGFSTNAETHLLPYINAAVIIKADPALKRTSFESGGHTQETQIRLHRDSMFCWSLQASFKGNLLQKMQPIEFSMEYRVAEDLNTRQDGKFCKLCPVTDPMKPSSVHVKIPFANGCGGKSICLADLKVEAQSSNNGQPIILGLNTKMIIKVSIVNSKEPAYLVKMSLILPKLTSLIKMPKHCYLEEEGSLVDPEQDVIMCGLGNIVESDQRSKSVKERTTNFEIDLSSVDLDTSLLNFNITTWSASEEQTPNDNTVVIEVPVRLISNVAIGGNTLQKHLILSSKDEVTPLTIPVIHKYEVTNLGPSPFAEITISLSLPFGLIVDEDFGMIIFTENINPQVTVKGHTSRCSVDYSTLNLAQVSRRKRDIMAVTNETEDFLGKNVFHLNCSETNGGRAACALVTCAVGHLSGGDTAEVKLQFNINRTMIDLIQQKDIIQISSTGWIEVPDKYEIPAGNRLKHAYVATAVVGNFEESISPWILPLSAIIGLFIFLFIVQMLSKAGFFRRKYKENMETMRDARQEFAYHKVLPQFENNIFY